MTIPPLTRILGGVSALATCLAGYDTLFHSTFVSPTVAGYAGVVAALSAAFIGFTARPHNTSDVDAGQDTFTRNVKAGESPPAPTPMAPTLEPAPKP